MAEEDKDQEMMTNEDLGSLMSLNKQLMSTNEYLSRTALAGRFGIDPRRSINKECGYPEKIDPSDYQTMYDREGMATRVVNIYPEETWVSEPVVVETEDPEETEFEEAWTDLEDDLQIYSYMARIDEISGIGRFGVLLMGFNDNKKLDEPVERKEGMELVYLRPFSESSVVVKKSETDPKNERYGLPVLYGITYESTTNSETYTVDSSSSTGVQIIVHYSRVVHIADNRKSSEVYGIPRMQSLFNRLYDIRKIAGGSGEMFWKGAFPGYSFEMDKSAADMTEAENKTLKEEIEKYSNGLQRYITLRGIQTKALSPQVGNPKEHIETQITIIAIALGIPKRIFQGSEQAKLASAQDTKSWNKRVARRQNKYVTPYVIKPMIDRLIEVGVLPEPADGYTVVWPDMNTPSEMDKADVLVKIVEAYAKYVSGSVDQLIEPKVFFSLYTDLTPEQIDQIENAGVDRIKELEDEANKLEDEEDE